MASSHFFYSGEKPVTVNKPTFEEATLDRLFYGASLYKKHFIDKEYLIFSRNLKENAYYILTGKSLLLSEFGVGDKGSM